MPGWGSRRLRAGTVAVVGLAALLAACSSSKPYSSSVSAPHKAVGSKVLLESVRTTAAAKTARYAISVSTGDSGASAISVSLSGSTDFGSGDSELTLHLGGAAASIFSGDLHERVVGNVVYLALPKSLRGGLSLPSGTHWYAVDLSSLGSASSSVPGLGQSDPKQFLAYLEAVSNDVQSVGTGTVRGVETTHYRASLNLAKAADRADIPPELRDAVQKLLAGSGGGSGTIPADVWIDSEGRVRRTTLTLDVASLGGLGGGSGAAGALPTVTVSVDLYDFGVPVKVETPPAGEVAQLPALGGVGGLGSASSASS